MRHERPVTRDAPQLDSVAPLCCQVAAQGVKLQALDPAVVLLLYAVQQVAAAVCFGLELLLSWCCCVLSVCVCVGVEWRSVCVSAERSERVWARG